MGIGSIEVSYSRKSCALRLEESHRHAVRKIRRVLSMKTSMNDRKRRFIEQTIIEG